MIDSTNITKEGEKDKHRGSISLVVEWEVKSSTTTKRINSIILAGSKSSSTM